MNWTSNHHSDINILAVSSTALSPTIRSKDLREITRSEVFLPFGYHVGDQLVFNILATELSLRQMTAAPSRRFARTLEKMVGIMGNP
jgi:hypothetical protein